MYKKLGSKTIGIIYQGEGDTNDFDLTDLVLVVTVVIVLIVIICIIYVYKRSRKDREIIIQLLSRKGSKTKDGCKGESIVNRLNAFGNREENIRMPSMARISIASFASRRSEYTSTPTKNKDFKAILRSISYKKKREINRKKNKTLNLRRKRLTRES